MENYLNVSLPQAQSISKSTKVSWGGLERRQYVNTGTMTNAMDISMDEYPYLTPSKQKLQWSWKNFSQDGWYSDCRGVFGFDDKLVVVYSNGSSILLDYYSDDTRILSTELKEGTDADQRSIVLFNVAVGTDNTDDFTVSNIANVTYKQKLLIFPDKISMDLEPTKTITTVDDTEVVEYSFNKKELADIPDIKYAVVHNSRLFGVDDGKIYASGFNDYTNWTLDTAEEYNESNAWVSTAQSNVKASGDFVGITAFQNHVICFKKDYMHEIYNNKNPFRVQDIYAEGAIDQRSIQDVGGMLIFADNDYVKVYTGGQPRILSYELNIRNITKAVAGNDGRKYYLYCVCDDCLRNMKQQAHLFVYDTITQLWSEESLFDSGNGYLEIQGFAKTDNGFFAVASNKNGTNSSLQGYIYQLDMNTYSPKWGFETDIMTNGTVDVKHLHKIQLYGEFASDSSIEVYMLYDGIYNGTELDTKDDINGGTADNVAKYKEIANYSNGGSATVSKYIRFIVPKSAHSGFKLRFRGSGYVKLYQMELFFRQGGELYNGS